MAVALLALAAGEVALVAGVPVADLGAVVVEADIYMIYIVVLQKVTSEANPKVRNQGEGPY